MRRMLTSIVTVVVAAYVALALVLYAFQPRFIYFPERRLDATPAALGLDYHDVSIDTRDGLKLHGWFIPARNPRGAVLFLHGNAGNISHRLDTIEIAHALNMSMLIIDYRGYGRSEGEPDERGTYEDAFAARQYLIDFHGFSPEQLVVHGRSLGGAIATWLASEHSHAGLIIESSFTSVRDMARHYYPFFPASLLVRIRYPTAQHIARVNCPLLIMHSPHDEIVPYEHGVRLFETATAQKWFMDLRGGHNDGFLLTGEVYRERLNRFLAEVVATEASVDP